MDKLTNIQGIPKKCLECKDSESCDYWCNAYDECAKKLREYEELELTPEQIREMDRAYSEQAKELGEYKNAEKQGLLLKFPCKVGDVLYQPTREIVSEFIVGCIEVSTCHHLFFHTKPVKGVNMTGEIFSQDEIGKTVFLTKDQAEATLEEMEGKKK